MSDRVDLHDWEKDEFAAIAAGLRDPDRCRGCGDPAEVHQRYSGNDYCGRCTCTSYQRPMPRWAYFLVHRLALRWYFIAAGAFFLFYFAVLIAATIAYGDGPVPASYGYILWPSFATFMTFWAAGCVLRWYRRTPRGMK